MSSLLSTSSSAARTIRAMLCSDGTLYQPLNLSLSCWSRLSTAAAHCFRARREVQNIPFTVGGDSLTLVKEKVNDTSRCQPKIRWPDGEECTSTKAEMRLRVPSSRWTISTRKVSGGSETVGFQ